MNVTPAQKAGYYLPLLSFFAYVWYMQKEFPRSQRIDLTCDSEAWLTSILQNYLFKQN